jgi:hydroxyacylglutathione hydrolase
VVAALADRERIPLQTRGVADGDRFTLLGQPVEVLAVPGHTRAHIAFHLPLQGELFCGDTLFAAGCGRLFEGSPEQMHHSLGLLAALPETTRVWCAHEYTASNLRWAAAQQPEDGAIAERLAAVLLARAQDRPTIPSSIGEERRTNLFMRAVDGQELAALRRSKNDWSD